MGTAGRRRWSVMANLMRNGSGRGGHLTIENDSLMFTTRRFGRLGGRPLVVLPFDQIASIQPAIGIQHSVGSSPNGPTSPGRGFWELRVEEKNGSEHLFIVWHLDKVVESLNNLIWPAAAE